MHQGRSRVLGLENLGLVTTAIPDWTGILYRQLYITGGKIKRIAPRKFSRFRK